tara:strand:- start:382 stop:1044 length:663 start_codon:yes stop_codon:yes gene_type:complete
MGNVISGGGPYFKGLGKIEGQILAGDKNAGFGPQKAQPEECGTPGKPPCDTERKLGSISSRGMQEGVKGTFTTTNYQTDFKIPGTSSGTGGSTPGSGGAFSNPQLPNQTYEEFQVADWGTPGKTHVKYKPPSPSYGETKRSDTNFVPDAPPDPRGTLIWEKPPSSPPPTTPPVKPYKTPLKLKLKRFFKKVEKKFDFKGGKYSHKSKRRGCAASRGGDGC